MAARHIAVSIVDVGHLRAEATDVDRRVVMDQTFAFEAMEHAENLLSFAHRENRNQHRSLAVDHAANGFGKFIFFVMPVVSMGALLRSASGFNDQRINRIFRKKCTFLQRAVFEVHIAGVHQAFAFAFDGDANRSENVARVMKGRAKRAVGVKVEGSLGAAMLKRVGDAVDFAMIEERVFGDAEFDAFRLHHVDRIVKHRGCKLGGFGSEEDPRALLLPKKNRQSADVIKM